MNILVQFIETNDFIEDEEPAKIWLAKFISYNDKHPTHVRKSSRPKLDPKSSSLEEIAIEQQPKIAKPKNAKPLSSDISKKRAIDKTAVPEVQKPKRVVRMTLPPEAIEDWKNRYEKSFRDLYYEGSNNDKR